MAKEGLGGLAKKWLQAKAKEVTTANRQQRDAAEYEADETGRQLKNDSIGEAVMTAVPGLRKLRDRQADHQRAAEDARDAAEAAELAARPVGHLELRLTGAMDGTWRGSVPALVTVRQPDGDAIEGDPFGGQPALVVDLGPVDDPAAAPGSTPVGGWCFEVPGYSGAGSYDLAESGMRRRAADAEPEYIDWELRFGDDGERFYFQPDIGPSTVSVAVAGDGRPARLDVTMSMTGGSGRVTAVAILELPPSDPD